jgi:hypothetical protein
VGGVKVLVCGGRDYGFRPKGCPSDSARHYDERARRERFMLDETLRDMHRTRGPFTTLIHGAAPGADALACSWALANGLSILSFRPDWKTLGRSAGPIRNQMMIEAGPDLVIAFPGGDGTADMVRRAKAAGVELLEVEQA